MKRKFLAVLLAVLLLSQTAVCAFASGMDEGDAVDTPETEQTQTETGDTATGSTPEDSNPGEGEETGEAEAESPAEAPAVSAPSAQKPVAISATPDTEDGSAAPGDSSNASDKDIPAVEKEEYVNRDNLFLDEDQTDRDEKNKDELDVDDEKKPNIGLAAVAIVACVIVLSLVIVVAGGRKRRAASPRRMKPERPVPAPKKSHPAPQGPLPAPGLPVSSNAIRMKIEDVDGTKKLKSAYYLDGEMTIGRGPECTVVVDDPAAARINCRVFMQDDLIFIEDLGSTNGTRIGGMRIYAPNRLRSGDHVTIGGTELIFRF